MGAIEETGETRMKYTCDVCKHVCWFQTCDTPKGWCTTRDDHDNSICPDCNPYIKRLKNPIAEKMKLVEAAFIITQ